MSSLSNITIRKARASDLDALSWIGIHAFPNEPQWPYRYPFARQFPDDHRHHTRQRYSEWLEVAQGAQCVIMVAEAPTAENPLVRRVISLSIWRMPISEVNKEPSDESSNSVVLGHVCGDLLKLPSVKPPEAKASRRDANASHMAAYRSSIGHAQERYFDQICGKVQLGLAQLATHPDYFCRGAATKLLEWGIREARKKRWPITVFAGPMAYKLYQRFGFERVVTVVAMVDGEKEELEFPGMVWDPREFGTRRRRYHPERLVVVSPPSQQTVRI